MEKRSADRWLKGVRWAVRLAVAGSIVFAILSFVLETDECTTRNRNPDCNPPWLNDLLYGGILLAIAVAVPLHLWSRRHFGER